ncbi:50S ribosomal protein L1, partial [Gammaproteobacteria bacterium]|nr:50S ribosomal protein L1 [Gammaproteobacteria bacterium]
AEHVEDNLNKLLSDLKSSRPASAKGVFFKKVTLSTTMGPGLGIDLSSLVV